MEQKVVLITGCSSGIGLGLAIHLASDPYKTYKVYATMRNLDKKQRLLESVRDLHNDTMTVLQMDITDQQSIRKVQGSITEGRVDILDKRAAVLVTLHELGKSGFRLIKRSWIDQDVLNDVSVCNAGVGLMGPLEAQSEDIMRAILEVNLLGTIRTIQTFLPDMKSRRQGRILVTGSMGGLQGLPFNEVYCASKFAVEGVCESLAILLQHFNIHVSLIECGPVNTDFLRNLKKTEVSDESVDVDAHTRCLYELYLQHCEKMFQNAAQDTDDIIQVYMEVIQAQCPVFRYYTNSALLPLSSLKLTALDGSQYIRAMSKLIFSSAENPDTQK